LAANHPPKAEPGNSRLASFREAQARSLDLPHTGMAVTIDIGDEKDVHPRNKQDVGKRLALIALAKTYGRPVECTGPVFESLKIDHGTARVKFSHAEGGLVVKGGPLKGFAVAGADQKFAWAEARIEGDAVILRSDRVASPNAVRYAWADNPAGCNLYNAAGLPAAPFRTDRAR
jgi:sialate O-acetylesterase